MIINGDEYKFFPDDKLLKINNKEYFLEITENLIYYGDNRSVQIFYNENCYELVFLKSWY